MATIINLTPHTVNIVDANGEILRSYESQGVARATQTAEPAGEVDGVELVRMRFGATEGLPKPQADTYFVVSIITANAAKAAGRTVDDLVITADPVRDDNGRIIGCKRFALV